ncbi:hypothetical protein EJ08DRAFT_647683 [Tothia fuscella]|uniref:Uncharacterized protein n=1 Tax=Tothia fuscella TaxID=1048955 RepID=A0A9P4NWF9_9PEZI|nr:hypothetical protein EJ08DRAFT_647683 [Tothia fuscella]
MAIFCAVSYLILVEALPSPFSLLSTLVAVQKNISRNDSIHHFRSIYDFRFINRHSL